MFPILIASVLIFGFLIAALLLAIKSQETAIRRFDGWTGDWDENSASDYAPAVTQGRR
jgi:hypothetical protein